MTTIRTSIRGGAESAIRQRQTFDAGNLTGRAVDFAEQVSA